jgi:predicted PurR-regulated permease PerM
MNTTHEEHREKLNKDNVSGLKKFTLILLFFFLFFGGLFFAREFLVPVSFAALLAMLLAPLCNRFEKWGVKRGLSSLLGILIILITIAGIITLFTTQIMTFAEDVPELQQRLNEKIEEGQSFIQQQFNVSPSKQIEFARARLNSILSNANAFVTGFISATTGVLAGIGLLLIYIFFFLFYRDRFSTFIQKIVSKDNHEIAKTITLQISKVTQQYLTGVISVIVILAVLNTTGLLIIGIEHAVFFGVLAAILNIVPYIGVLIGSLFPIIMAFLTKDSIWSAVGVAGVFAFNQFLENNFLTPNITGSQVKINPLAAIMALIIGGMIWGVAGMILFIPFIGIAKILFDNIESLQPYGYIIGEDDDENGKDGFFKRILNWVKGIFRKKS